MLRHVLFDLNLFPDEASRANSQKRVLVLLEALTLCNQFYLAENPDTPLMYQLASEGIIRYKLPAQFDPTEAPGAAEVMAWLRETNAPRNVMDAFRTDQTMLSKIINGEVFRDIPRIIQNGGGDCDNVASWRAAEIRHRLGIAAKPYITWRKRPDGGTTYHVIVIWPDGSSEDPSLLLGMKKDDGGAALREEQRKLGERASEMLSALGGHNRERVAGEIRRRAQLVEAVGLLLRGAA